MWTSIRYILLCALRDRLFVGLMISIVAATLVSAALGTTAFLEEKEMSLAYAGAAARLILSVGMIVFCCFHIRNNFDTREIDVMLSRPVSRARLVFSFWLGFSIIGLLLVIPTAIIMSLIGILDLPGFFAWCVSLLLETWLVAAIALFTALALKSAVTSVITCLGIYVLSRMMAFFVMTASTLGQKEPIVVVSKYALKTISTVVPRLDFFGKTEWLVYGLVSGKEWQLFVLQALIFIPLLIIAAIIDFQRKQF